MKPFINRKTESDFLEEVGKILIFSGGGFTKGLLELAETDKKLELLSLEARPTDGFYCHPSVFRGKKLR